MNKTTQIWLIGVIVVFGFAVQKGKKSLIISSLINYLENMRN
jgi:hypothetical protein